MDPPPFQGLEEWQIFLYQHYCRQYLRRSTFFCSSLYTDITLFLVPKSPPGDGSIKDRYSQSSCKNKCLKDSNCISPTSTFDFCVPPILIIKPNITCFLNEYRLPTYPLRTRWHIRLIPDPSIYSFSTSFRVFPIFFRSPSIVLLQVSLGLPWLLFPSAGVHLSAIFVMDWFPFLKTWPSHLNWNEYRVNHKLLLTVWSF